MATLNSTWLLFLSFILLATMANSVTFDCLGGSEDDESISEPVADEVKVVLDQGERAFGVNLVKSLFQSFDTINENIFISPASIYQTLMLAYMGAKAETADEIATTLGFSGMNRTDVVKNYLFERAFQAIRDRNPELGYTLIHANKFFFDRSLDLNKCLQLVLANEMEALDFSNAHKARKAINNWVEEKTKQKIKDLLPADALDGGSKVALVNAAYFKGEWEAKFEKAETKKDNFYVKRDQISTVKFMKQKGQFNYYTSEELRAHVLEMPYKGDDISMVVILPPFEDDSLFETVRRLTPETMQGVMAEVRSGFYQVDDLTVEMPKFRLEQSFELAETLSKLGVSSLFSSSSDLSGFVETDEGEKVQLESAVHKSFIEVNEEGSEAAAATALFGFRSARPLFHTHFIANHPFLFLIYDKPSDTILFFGVYQDPKFSPEQAP